MHWHAWKHGLSASVLFAVDGPYACTVSVARMLSGEGASSTVYNVTRGYYVRTIVYVLPTVYAGQGSAPQARSGSIYMCDVRKVKIRTPPRNKYTPTHIRCPGFRSKNSKMLAYERTTPSALPTHSTSRSTHKECL